MDMTNARLCLIAVLACIATPAVAESPESLDLTAVGKDPRWKIAGRTTSIVDIKGKHALKVSEAEGMGVVWLDGDEWFHVRVVVERPKVSVFVNGASAPCLVVQELSDRVHGSLGLWVGESSGGHFANLRVTRAR